MLFSILPILKESPQTVRIRWCGQILSDSWFFSPYCVTHFPSYQFLWQSGHLSQRLYAEFFGFIKWLICWNWLYLISSAFQKIRFYSCWFQSPSLFHYVQFLYAAWIKIRSQSAPFIFSSFLPGYTFWLDAFILFLRSTIRLSLCIWLSINVSET